MQEGNAMAEHYNENLRHTDQVDMEGAIAAKIFDDPDVEVTEVAAGDLARAILWMVLKKFRPDLFDDTE